MRTVLPTLHVRPSPQAVPLAAGCLAAALPEALRAEARLLDLFPSQSEEAMAAAVLAEGPDLVAFPLYLWNRERLLALARRLRRERPGVRLIAGGPEASADPHGVLAEGELDGVVRGEGEETFAELAAILSGGGDPAGLAGLSWSGAGKEVIAGPERPPVASLDTLPSPWLSGVLRPGAGVLWEIARGCPFNCDFCFDARGSQGVRHLGSERLHAELELFVRAGVRQVWVLDSTFNYPPERGKALLRLLARQAPELHFHLEAKADFLDRETARLLTRVPCSVQIGLQSVRPEVLANIHRSFDAGRFAEKLHLLAAEGVTFGLDLIFGLPGDDLAGFRESLAAALSFAPNHVDLFPLAVLPGTPLDRRRERFGLQAPRRPPYTVEASATCPAPDLERCRELAAATDLFYNLGRAVGFFGALLAATELTAVPFLEGFAAWLLQERQVPRQRLLAATEWQPEQVRRLQEGYVEARLAAAGQASLWSAARDLIRYHFHYAETLLGPETLPPGKPPGKGVSLWRRRWRLAPGVRLVTFSYEILDLLQMGEMELEPFVRLFRPVGSVGLFARRGEEVFCESLQEDFQRLLQGCDGRRTAEEIFAGTLPRREGEELLAFAVGEGMLVPAAATAPT